MTGFQMPTGTISAGYVLTASTSANGLGVWKSSPASLLVNGTTTGQTLYWNNTTGQWTPNTYLFNNTESAYNRGIGINVGYADTATPSILSIAGGGITIDGIITRGTANARIPVGNTNTFVEDISISRFTSLTIGKDGLPVISYVSNSGLSVAHCNNLICSSVTTTTIDSSGAIGYYNSIVIGKDGYPIISYYDGNNDDLRVVHCGSINCASGNTSTTLDSTNDVGKFNSITVGTDGFPIISYQGDSTSTAPDLKVVHCTALDCSTYDTPVVAFGDAYIRGEYTSIAIGTDGLPIISSYTPYNKCLLITHCDNTSCSSNSTACRDNPAKDVGWFSSITIGRDGLPIISEINYTDGYLRVLHCGNVSCSAGNNASHIDTSGTVDLNTTSITITPDGYPLIAYRDTTNNSFKIARCGNYDCSANSSISIITTSTSNGFGYYNSIAIGSDGLPVISNFKGITGDYDLYVYKCGNALCRPYWTRR
ncbi:hypothetical protein HY227_02740 [Candidatus Wolfebacteria bacterium]|nr:hypothetical protein [Candidatus Wolfebacteria bacterium]